MQQQGADPVDLDAPAASDQRHTGPSARRPATRPAARPAPRRAPGPSSGPVRRAALVAATALALAALVTALPGALGLAGTVPLAQLLPFRGALAVLLLAAALLVALAAAAAAAVRRRLNRSHRERRTAATATRRRSPSPAAVLATGLALAGAVHAGVLVSRGVLPQAPPQDADLVVLSLNTLHGAAGPHEVADAVTSAGADVVMLPETPAALAEQVVAVLAERQRPYSASTAATGPAPTHATSLLLADDLGAPVPAAAPRVELAAVAASVGSLPGPVVAVHPVAPVPTGTMVERWRADVPRAAAACADQPGAVVAGDFNATLDHPGLRDLGPCVDAAAAAGAGGLGTWPATVPQLLAAPIDHVLVDGRAWRVLSAQVVTVGGSDHRGLVVHLDRR